MCYSLWLPMPSILPPPPFVVLDKKKKMKLSILLSSFLPRVRWATYQLEEDAGMDGWSPVWRKSCLVGAGPPPQRHLSDLLHSHTHTLKPAPSFKSHHTHAPVTQCAFLAEEGRLVYLPKKRHLFLWSTLRECDSKMSAGCFRRDFNLVCVCVCGGQNHSMSMYQTVRQITNMSGGGFIFQTDMGRIA